MAGSFPRDPSQLIQPLASGSRPYYALVDGSSHIEYDRQWTIGNLGDSYGYSQFGGYGGLVSNLWFDEVDEVFILTIDQSSNGVIFRSTTTGQWDGQATVTLQVEGYGKIILTWNGSTDYLVGGATAFVAYITSQLGNSIGLNILPRNTGPDNIVTTLDDEESTTLLDNIIHTGG